MSVKGDREIVELREELAELDAAAAVEGGCFWCDGCGNGSRWLMRIMKDLAKLGAPEGVAYMEGVPT